MRKKEERPDIDIASILEEYAPDRSVFRDEGEKAHRTKVAVFRDLDETDRRIILVYAHLGNVRDTAEVFRVSSTTIWNRIRQIRERIKKTVGEYEDTD